jgi:hypothetical protein
MSAARERLAPVFVTPDDPNFTTEESLRMGGRRTMIRVEDKTVHVTTILITDFDGDTPTYQVHHVSFLEPVIGQRDITAEQTDYYTDLELAMMELVQLHHDPPVGA